MKFMSTMLFCVGRLMRVKKLVRAAVTPRSESSMRPLGWLKAHTGYYVSMEIQDKAWTRCLTPQATLTAIQFVMKP